MVMTMFGKQQSVLLYFIHRQDCSTYLQKLQYQLLGTGVLTNWDGEGGLLRCFCYLSGMTIMTLIRIPKSTEQTICCTFAPVNKFIDQLK